MYNDVKEFHEKFNIPVAGEEPCRIPDYEVVEYRTKFLEEELQEFKDACKCDSLVKALDALGDIVWVAMGTAHYFRAPFDEVWAEIKRANNDRVLVTRDNCPPEKQYRKDMVMKPPGWKEPDIMRIIREHNMAIKQRELNGAPNAPANDQAAELRALHAVLKSGDYSGVDIMHAWITLEEYANLLERVAETGGEPNGFSPGAKEVLSGCVVRATIQSETRNVSNKSWDDLAASKHPLGCMCAICAPIEEGDQ